MFLLFVLPCVVLAGAPAAEEYCEPAGSAGQLGFAPEEGEDDGSLALLQRRGAKQSSSSVMGAGASEAPLAWCNSGGGWLAMAVGIGLANAFHDGGLLSAHSLSNVATNSGGSWFLTQFAYNAEFYEKVVKSNASALHDFVHNLLVAYESVVPGFTPSNPVFALFGEMTSAAPVLDEMTGVAAAAAGVDFNWRVLVNKMLASTPGIPDGGLYQATQADTASRVGGLKRPTLHFATSLLTSGVLWDGIKDKDSYLVGKNGSPLKDQGGGLPASPMQYIVPGPARESSASPAPAGLWRPRSTLFEYEAAQIGEVDSIFPEWGPPQDSFFWRTRSAPTMPTVMTVADVASISSAAAGAAASPEIIKEVVTTNLNGLAFDAVKEGLPYGMSGLSVCAWPAEDNTCGYPNFRFVDGGYLDNQATASTVSYMQAQYPTQQRLRMVLTNSVVKGMLDQQWNLQDISYLMRHVDVAPGHLIKGSSYAGGSNLPSPQVFAQVFAEIEWVNIAPAPIATQFFNLTWANLTTHTVDNPAYGVKAGTPVDLLIFNVASSLSSFQVGFSKQYAQVSKKLATSPVSSIVKEWLSRG